MSLNTEQTRARSPALQLPAVWPWERRATSLSLRFLLPLNVDRGSIVIVIMYKAPFPVSLFLGIV